MGTTCSIVFHRLYKKMFEEEIERSYDYYDSYDSFMIAHDYLERSIIQQSLLQSRSALPPREIIMSNYGIDRHSDDEFLSLDD